MEKDQVELFYADDSEIQEVTKTVEETPEIPQEKKTLFVDVCGAVLLPGVYEIEAGGRVFQAVEAAGGFSEEAVKQEVNLARILQDEDHIYIPSREDLKNPSFSENPECGLIHREDGKIDINSADMDELIQLTGIGESRARAILSYREENGRFTSIDEIMNVQGIKEGTFIRIKDEIVVG